MDNEDRALVLEAIGNLAAKVDTYNDKVETYHGDFREFRGEITTKVEDLEQDAKDDRMWHRIQVICVLPVVGVLHQVAQHFGWIK